MGKARKLITGTVVVAAAGYLAGILTAPKSGKETRKDIQRKAIEAKKEAERKLKKLHSEMDDLITQGKKKASKLNARAKTEWETLLASSSVAKEKMREVLSAIHEGDTDDKELQKAIKDADKAIAHLKNYLSKDAK